MEVSTHSELSLIERGGRSVWGEIIVKKVDAKMKEEKVEKKVEVEAEEKEEREEEETVAEKWGRKGVDNECTQVLTQPLTTSLEQQGIEQGIERGIERGRDLSQREVHLLELSIEGSCTLIPENSEVSSLYGFLGCFVVYSIPNNLSENEVEREVGKGAEGGVETKMSINERRSDIVSGSGSGSGSEKESFHKLWWDSECSVLNGRTRHTFECHSISDIKSLRNNPLHNSSLSNSQTTPNTHTHAHNTQNNDTHSHTQNTHTHTDTGTHTHTDTKNRQSPENTQPTENTARNIFPQGLHFQLIEADSEGCLPPLDNRKVIATCQLSSRTIQEILLTSVTKTVALPLIMCKYGHEHEQKHGQGDNIDTTNDEKNENKQIDTNNRDKVNPYPVFFLSLTLSHRIQPVLYRSIEIKKPNTLSSARTNTAVLTLSDQIENKIEDKMMNLESKSVHDPSHRHNDIQENNENENNRSSVMDIILSPYEKLKQGLFSWERQKKGVSVSVKSSLGQGGLGQGGLGQGDGSGQVQRQGVGVSQVRERGLIQSGVRGEEGRHKNNLGGEYSINDRDVVGGKERKGEREEVREGEEVGEGEGDNDKSNAVIVTVGRITNLPIELIKILDPTFQTTTLSTSISTSFSTSATTSTLHTTEKASQISDMRKGQGNFLFCMVESNSPERDEVKTVNGKP